MTAGLRALVVIGSAGYLALYAVLLALRVRYPFELEWLEGCAVDHIRTILAGRPLYAPPALEFTPLTYTPGFFYLAAALTKLLGVGFLAPRLISIVSATALLGVMFSLAMRETGSRLAGLLAAGLFAATFGWSGGWFDLARNDSLFLLLATLAVYVLRWHDSPRAAAVAGVLISAAFLTKQTGLIVAVPLAVCCAIRGWRSGVVFTATVAGVVYGTSMLFTHWWGRWYLYYIWQVPDQHPVAMQSIVGFWRYDLLRPFPVGLTVAIAYLLRELRGPRSGRAWFYLLASAGFVGGAWVSRLHSLSFINVVLPAYEVVALVFAIAVFDGIPAGAGEGTARLRQSNGNEARWRPVLLYGACVLQLLLLAYKPGSFVPTTADVQQGERLLHQIAAIPGLVWLPDHGYLPVLAGRPSLAHAAVLADVIRGVARPEGKQLEFQLEEALRTHRFAAVIAPDAATPTGPWIPLEAGYEAVAPVVTERSRFWRREVLYLPREARVEMGVGPKKNFTPK